MSVAEKPSAPINREAVRAAVEAEWRAMMFAGRQNGPDASLQAVKDFRAGAEAAAAAMNDTNAAVYRSLIEAEQDRLLAEYYKDRPGLLLRLGVQDQKSQVIIVRQQGSAAGLLWFVVFVLLFVASFVMLQ